MSIPSIRYHEFHKKKVLNRFLFSPISNFFCPSLYQSFQQSRVFWWCKSGTGARPGRCDHDTRSCWSLASRVCPRSYQYYYNPLPQLDTRQRQLDTLTADQNTLCETCNCQIEGASYQIHDLKICDWQTGNSGL